MQLSVETDTASSLREQLKLATQLELQLQGVDNAYIRGLERNTSRDRATVRTDDPQFARMFDMQVDKLQAKVHAQERGLSARRVSARGARQEIGAGVEMLLGQGAPSLRDAAEIVEHVAGEAGLLGFAQVM